MPYSHTKLHVNSAEAHYRTPEVPVNKPIIYIAFLTASTACSSDADNLAGWEGNWSSQSRFLDDPAMDPAYEAIAAEYNIAYSADSGITHTVATVKAHWQMLYGTDFAAASFSSDVATFSAGNGDTIAEIVYQGSGCEQVFYSGPDNDWSLEESEDAWDETWCGFDGAEAAGTYRTLVMTEFHSHGDALPHGHLRYGDVRLEDLWSDSFTGHGRNNHYWWPTLVPDTMTASDYATLETTNRAENAEYLTY